MILETEKLIDPTWIAENVDRKNIRIYYEKIKNLCKLWKRIFNQSSNYYILFIKLLLG
jgi:hypothetical protein